MSFEKLLRPQSVAVVGASSAPGKVGWEVLNNVISGGFEGPVYPINPQADEILGKKCYKSLADVPGPVDCAVIVIKKDLVLRIMHDCVAKGIKGVVVITAGFGETGETGRMLQREIAQVARDNGISMLGPNCLGLLNPWHKLNTSFGQPLDVPGNIALISQSGALITAMQDMASNNHIGFSVIASLGNKASLGEVEFLENLKGDKNSTVIAAYLEDIGNGQEFMRVAERVSKTKPVVILKSGRTQAGARAASSHTGSLAGADASYASAFERTGVIRAESIEHLFDVSTALAYQPLPRGNRIAVVTNAGGPGIMMSDALELAGLQVAKLDDVTNTELLKFMPAAGSIHNPVDVLGDANGPLYGKTIEVLLASQAVDGLIVIMTPQKMTDDVAIATEITRLSANCGKPVFACLMGVGKVAKGVAVLHANRVPQYPIPERAARAMLEMVKYAQYKSRPLRVVERFPMNKNPIIKIFRAYRAKGMLEVGEYDAKMIMKAYNFDTPNGMLATTVDEAVRFAQDVGFPLAMKISSPDILHKSDVGGVKVGLASASAVEDAFELMMLRIKRRMPNAEIRGVLLEKMVTGGREVILGMKKDPQFGPMLMFGLGGIFVEVLRDVTFSLAPVTAEECQQMISRTKTYKLLKGVRGEKAVDMDALIINMQRLSQLVMDFPEIEEIDINPLKVGYEGDGATVVDARIIIGKEKN